MNARSLLRPVRRLWPQKVRTRLTLIYAAPFLVAGLAVFGLALFVLQKAILPTSPTAALGRRGKPAGSVAQICQAYTMTSTHLCEQAYAAYYAGTVAGMQAQQNTLAKLLGFWALGLGVMTVASGGLGWYISGRLLRPVREITATARRASEQHLGERLALAGPKDELRELADTFDDMLERLDAAFAAQRRFVANASHELRTPLTVMRTAIDVTLAKPSPTARQLTDTAVRVRRSIDKAESMIEALLTIAVSDQGKLSTEFTDLATMAEDAIDAAGPEIERLNLKRRRRARPGRDHRGPATARADDRQPGRQRRPAQRARRLDQAVHRQQRRGGAPQHRQQRAVHPGRRRALAVRAVPAHGGKDRRPRRRRARPVHRPLGRHRPPRDRHRKQPARGRPRHLGPDPARPRRRPAACRGPDRRVSPHL